MGIIVLLWFNLFSVIIIAMRSSYDINYYYKKAIKLAPEYTEAYIYLAISYHLTNSDDKLNRLFLRVKELKLTRKERNFLFNYHKLI